MRTTKTITTKAQGGFLKEYDALHPDQYSVKRKDFPQLSWQQYANFRMVTTSGMRQGVLYRTAILESLMGASYTEVKKDFLQDRESEEGEKVRCHCQIYPGGECERQGQQMTDLGPHISVIFPLFSEPTWAIIEPW